MRHPGTGESLASSLEAADETREGRKGPPLRQTAGRVIKALPYLYRLTVATALQPSTTHLAE